MEKRVTIFEFYPLPGDPTPEEIAAAQAEEFKSEMDYAASVQKMYEEMQIKN